MKEIFKDYLKKVTSKENLSFDEAYMANKFIMSGEANDSQIAGFLLALKTKGETVDEIAGMAKGMKELGLSFSDKFTGLIDNCGTGGDASNSFNISTTCSFVLSGAGLKVAKHGNRSITSKSGSSDLLTALGVNINLSKEKIEKLIDEIGIAFLFAPNMHPNMKYVMKVRLDLGIPTVFNILGPLTNPFNISSQLLGIYREELVVPMAQALIKLGRKKAVVISGAGKLDEATLSGDNIVVFADESSVKTIKLDPRSLGFNLISNDAIKGGTSEENAKITLSILNGDKGAPRDTVILNSALGIIAGGLTDDLMEATEIARKSIDSGNALGKLNALIRESNK